MPSLHTVKIGSDRFMGMIIGPNGFGKSGIAASFPKPLKFFDFDGRMNGVKRLYPHIKPGEIEYDVYGPKATGDRKSIVDFQNEIEMLLVENPWATIVVDGTTSYTTTAVVFQMIRKGNPLFGGFKGDTQKLTKGGLEVPSWDEFNGEAMAASIMLDILKGLNCNVVLTAHPIPKTVIKEGEPTKTITTIATFGIKVPAIIPIYFDEIYYLDRRQDTMEAGKIAGRVIQTQPIGDTIAKSSLPIPAEIPVPTIGKSDCCCCRDDGYFYGVWKNLVDKGVERLMRPKEESSSSTSKAPILNAKV